MKKPLLIVTATLLFCSACEKDYTCECRNPMLPTNAPAATYPLNDKTHRQAKKECQAYEFQNSSGWGGLDCALK